MKYFLRKKTTLGSLLLAVIYLAFISLGLPDSLLGSGWPAMQSSLNVPSSYAGYISMTISLMTAISSLFSPHLIKKNGRQVDCHYFNRFNCMWSIRVFFCQPILAITCLGNALWSRCRIN